MHVRLSVYRGAEDPTTSPAMQQRKYRAYAESKRARQCPFRRREGRPLDDWMKLSSDERIIIMRRVMKADILAEERPNAEPSPSDSTGAPRPRTLALALARAKRKRQGKKSAKGEPTLDQEIAAAFRRD